MMLNFSILASEERGDVTVNFFELLVFSRSGTKVEKKKLEREEIAINPTQRNTCLVSFCIKGSDLFHFPIISSSLAGLHLLHLQDDFLIFSPSFSLALSFFFFSFPFLFFFLLFKGIPCMKRVTMSGRSGRSAIMLVTMT